MLVSEGELSEYQSTVLGVYDRAEYMWVFSTRLGVENSYFLNFRFHGFPVYVQRGGKRFIYRGSADWWYANGDFGAETGVLRTKDLNSTGGSWYYGAGGGWVNNDTTIELVTLDSPLAHCLTCKTISIGSTGKAKDTVPDFLGIFDRVEGIYMDGRPVYRNGKGKFFHKDGKATYGVRTKYTGDGVSVQSASGPICAFLEKASQSERFGHGWKFWTGNGWEHDLTLGASCTVF